MDHRKRTVGTGIGGTTCRLGKARLGDPNEDVWASVVVTPVGITPIRACGRTFARGDGSIVRHRRNA